MKVRMIVVTLALALVAWGPAAAQQSSALQAATQQAPAAADHLGKTTSKPACKCCGQSKDQGKDSTFSKMSCCHGKSVDCCNNGSEAAKDCCTGENTQCAAKNGKACCGKNMTACNKNGKDCCAGAGGCCSGSSPS